MALGAFVAPGLWLGLFTSLCLLVHQIAILAAIYSRGPHRAFWIGFLVLGWPHLLAAMLKDDLRWGIQRWMLPDSLIADVNDYFSWGLTYTSLLATRFYWAMMMALLGGYVARTLYWGSVRSHPREEADSKK